VDDFTLGGRRQSYALTPSLGVSITSKHDVVPKPSLGVSVAAKHDVVPEPSLGVSITAKHNVCYPGPPAVSVGKASSPEHMDCGSSVGTPSDVMPAYGYPAYPTPPVTKTFAQPAPPVTQTFAQPAPPVLQTFGNSPAMPAPPTDPMVMVNMNHFAEYMAFVQWRQQQMYMNQA